MISTIYTFLISPSILDPSVRGLAPWKLMSWYSLSACVYITRHGQSLAVTTCLRSCDAGNRHAHGPPEPGPCRRCRARGARGLTELPSLVNSAFIILFISCFRKLELSPNLNSAFAISKSSRCLVIRQIQPCESVRVSPLYKGIRILNSISSIRKLFVL